MSCAMHKRVRTRLPNFVGYTEQVFFLDYCRTWKVVPTHRQRCTKMCISRSGNTDGEGRIVGWASFDNAFNTGIGVTEIIHSAGMLPPSKLATTQLRMVLWAMEVWRTAQTMEDSTQTYHQEELNIVPRAHCEVKGAGNEYPRSWNTQEQGEIPSLWTTRAWGCGMQI